LARSFFGSIGCFAFDLQAAVSTVARSEVTLKGSVETVTEFFGFAINSILYQRGIYPPDSFATAMKYGLPMQVSSDEGLKAYLS